MNNSIHVAGKLGLIAALTATLTGCVTHVHNSPEVRTVYVPAPAPEPYTPPPAPAPVVVVQPAPIIIQAPAPVVEIPTVIHTEADFNGPLSPYGEWIVVQGYGRCWRPRSVDVSWRPYAEGRWEWTEAGWYWVSEEPWGWATYHYGRWDWTPEFGWIWAPQTQWAPAWVTWREGAGYIGWAPLPPTAHILVNGSLEIRGTIPTARFCFIETPRLLHPIRHDTVIVNNTTIVNKTVNVTKVKVVNNVVINEGPRTDNIERATGRPLLRNSVSEVRRRDEAEARESRSRNHLSGQVNTPDRHDPPPRTDREVKTGGIDPRPSTPPQVVAVPPPVVAQPPAPEPVRTIPTRPLKQAPERGGVKPDRAEHPVAKNITPAPQPVVEPPERHTPPVNRQPSRLAEVKPEKTPEQPAGPAPVEAPTHIQPAAAVPAIPPTPPQVNPPEVNAPAPQTGHGPTESNFKSPKEASSKKGKEKDKDKGQDKNEDKKQEKQRKGAE